MFNLQWIKRFGLLNTPKDTFWEVVEAEDGGFVAIIDLKSNEVNSLNRVSEKAQVTYSLAEVFMATELTKADERYQEALKKRGITDLDMVQIDPWPAGGVIHESIKPGHRALKTISFLRENQTDNA